MDSEAVPAALRERLGPEATTGLVDLLHSARLDWRDDVIAACGERFGRRLAGEMSGLRLEIMQGDAALRQEMTELGASLRQEMTELGASLRQESTESAATLRQEIAGLRADMWAGRVELLKWCFVFWVGQVVAVAGVLAVMLRLWRT